LESIRLPSTVSDVGERAFHNCCELREVKLNKGLLTIAERAFSGCSSLESIALPSTVSDIGKHAFSYCSSLKEVKLKEGLLAIGEGAFQCCSSLESIALPSTVSDVGEHAFVFCTSLREVVLSEGLKTIGEEAFDGCSSLESFTFPCIFTRLDHIICSVNKTQIQNMINEVPGVARRGGDLLISFEGMGGGENWETHRESLCQICRLITYYESKEATTIIELALWKAKIEEGRVGIDDRKICCVEVSGPVKRARIEGERANSDNCEASRFEIPGPAIDAEVDDQGRVACRVLCRGDIVMKGVLQFVSNNHGW